MTNSNHKSYQELELEIKKISDIIPIWSLREHYKTMWKYYEITWLVVDESTDEIAVPYRPIKSDIVFVRLAKIFLEKVQWKNWITNRFKKL